MVREYFYFPGRAELFGFLSGRRAYNLLDVGKREFRVMLEFMVADDDAPRSTAETLKTPCNDGMEHPDRSIWIHQYQNLHTVDLFETGLLELPEEIGNLPTLKRLYLHDAHIQSLPASIGKLQNLRCLDLSYTPNLYTLPKEIGDLASLESLGLSKSAITSLPPSIGRLQNLQSLHLFETKNLLQLPQEIGDLASLKKLNLSRSAIKSLPPSIGRLQNLQSLYLAGTKNLLQLPEEIGNLTNLLVLEFIWIYWEEGNELHIPVLPKSIVNLKRLQYLGIGTQVYERPEKSVLELIQACRSLSSFGWHMHLTGLDDTRIGRALVLNRARYKMSRTLIDSGNANKQCGIRMSSKLWPHILENATNAFHWHPSVNKTIVRKSRSSITKADAIYQLLSIVGTEAFVGALLHDREEEVKEAPDMDWAVSGNEIRDCPPFGLIPGRKRKREGEFVSTHT